MSDTDPFDFRYTDAPSRGDAADARLLPEPRPAQILTPSPVPESPRRHPLSTPSLVLALLSVLAVGVGTFASLASVDVTSTDPVGGLLMWATVAAVGVLLAAVAFVLSGVALMRPARGLPFAALLVVVLLVPAAGVVGFQAGITVLHGKVARDVARAGSVALQTLDESLARVGPVTEPLREWLDREFGDGVP